MAIIAIDPGTRNTGLVYMDEARIIACKTIHFVKPCKNDQREVMERALSIATQVSNWLVDKPHEAVVIEGFLAYQKRQSAYTWQTPMLCGALYNELKEDNVIVQTSAEVLNPARRGNMAAEKQALAEKKEIIADVEKLRNDHLRSAATHGLYYYRRKNANK